MRVEGFLAEPELNGLPAEMLGWDDAKQRWQVRVFRMNVDGMRDVLNRRPNLRMMSTLEFLAFKASFT